MNCRRGAPMFEVRPFCLHFSFRADTSVCPYDKKNNK